MCPLRHVDLREDLPHIRKTSVVVRVAVVVVMMVVMVVIMVMVMMVLVIVVMVEVMIMMMFMVVIMFEVMLMVMMMLVIVVMVVIMVVVMLVVVIVQMRVLLRHCPVEIRHVVVVVFVYCVQNDVKAAAVDSCLLHAMNIDGKSFIRDRVQGAHEYFLIRAKIQQRRNAHIPADAGSALEIQCFSAVKFRHFAVLSIFSRFLPQAD